MVRIVAGRLLAAPKAPIAEIVNSYLELADARHPKRA